MNFIPYLLGLLLFALLLCLSGRSESYTYIVTEKNSGERTALKMSEFQAPLGTIVIWPGDKDDIPEGWALCDGESVSNFPELDEAWDGQVETIPDLRGQVPFYSGTSQGKVDHLVSDEQLPCHDHDLLSTGLPEGTVNGVLYKLYYGIKGTDRADFLTSNNTHNTVGWWTHEPIQMWARTLAQTTSDTWTQQKLSLVERTTLLNYIIKVKPS